MSLAQWALWGVCLALLGALVVLSRGPARWLFGAGFVADVVAKAGHVLVLFDAPKPLSVAWITGALSWHERAAYHVDVMLVSLWPFGCCALAWWAFCGPKANGPDGAEPPQSESYTGVDDGSDSRGSMAGIVPTVKAQKANGPDESEPPGRVSTGEVQHRGPREGLEGQLPGALSMTLGSHAVKAILASWLIFSLAMAVLFPLPRGMTQHVLHAVYLALAALSALSLMLGWSRRRERGAVAASWLFAGQVVVALIGPFIKSPFEPGGWDVARWGYCTLFLLLLVRHVLWLRPR